MNPEDEVSPRELNDIAWDVRDGMADPEDVKRVLIYFCGLVEENRPLPLELRKYLKDAFRSYLDKSSTSIESALGLKRGKRGRPKANEDERIAIATEILRHRLSGSSHEEAVSKVGEEFHKGSTVIGEAWATFKQDAIYVLRMERPLDHYPWTQDEVQRLSEIYEEHLRALQKLDEPWFVPPGKGNN